MIFCLLVGILYLPIFFYIHYFVYILRIYESSVTSAVLRLECSLDCLSAPTLWRYDVAV